MPEVPGIPYPPPRPTPPNETPPLGPGLKLPQLKPFQPSPPAPPAPAPVPPQVTPPAKGGGGGLGDLGWFALIFVAFGLLALVNALTEFLNWFRLWLLSPFLRGRTPPPLTTKQLTQPLSNALGKAVQGIDAHTGGSFAALAAEVRGVGSALAADAQVLYQLARRLVAVEGHSAATGARTQTLQAELAQQDVKQRQAAQRSQATDRQQAARLDTLGQAQHATTEHVTHLIEPELEALRHRIHTLERGATTTWEEVRKHEELLGAAAFTAATATALGRLGGGWIRCEANQVLGRENCRGGPDAARDLLSVLAVGGALLGLREYVKLMQPITATTTRGIAAILRVTS